MGNTAKFHPLTGALLVPLGTRKDGRAIWPIMGGSEPAPEPSGDPQGDPAPEPTPEPTPADDPKDDGKGGKSAILADLAKERDARQALQRQVEELLPLREQFTALAKVFGPADADTPPDPVKLAEQVTQEQARAREAAVQLEVYKNAAANGANPVALLDSASFLRSVAEVDPSDSQAVADAIKAAIEANPLLKAADTFPSPGQAGIGVSGGGSGPVDPIEADRRQIEADLAAAKRR